MTKENRKLHMTILKVSKEWQNICKVILSDNF